MNSYLIFLSRNKVYTAIEAIGLAVSLAFVILIGSYVQQQYSVSRQSPDCDRIYTVGTTEFLALSWWDKASLEDNIPEVETAARVTSSDEEAVTFGDQSFLAKVTSLDKEFFDMFPEHKVLKGSLQDFDTADGILVSESFATRISKEQEDIIIGRTIELDGKKKVIAGVIQDIRNSMFEYSDIITNTAFGAFSHHPDMAFKTVGQYTTFFRVNPNADRATVEEKVQTLCHKNYGDWFDEFIIYSCPEAYFCQNSYNLNTCSKSTLRTLSIVALLLLLSAVFNYINLSVALTGKRAKEMATRRLVGASKASVFRKYIAESVAFTAVCFAAAVLIAAALLPVFNKLLAGEGNQTLINPVTIKFTIGYLLAYLLSILALGFLSGFIPALLASRYESIDVIKGTFRLKSKMVFSKVFIILQNTISVIAIAMALLMEVQMSHMMSRPMNASVEDLYFIKTGAESPIKEQALTDKLSELSCVKRTGFGNSVPGVLNMSVGIKKGNGEETQLPLIICDTAFFDMLKPIVVNDFGRQRTGGLWLGRTAFNTFEASDTSAFFNNKFEMNGANCEFLAGEIEDLPTGDPAQASSNPCCGILIQEPQKLRYVGILVEATGDHDSAKKEIISVIKSYQEETKGVYIKPYFCDYVLDIQHDSVETTRRSMRLVELFTILVVILSLLGLIAMSEYYSEQKAKEIAVRKVFGGTITTESWNSIRNYVLMALASCAFGAPIAVFLAGKYLERFSCRISGIWWIIAAACLISLTISIASVLWQTLRAARTNPAEELKKD